MGNNNSLIILAIFVFILYLAASGKLTQIVKVINPNAASSGLGVAINGIPTVRNKTTVGGT